MQTNKAMRAMKNYKSKHLLLCLCIFCFLPLTAFSAALGDVNSNGSIDIIDAMLTARYAAGLNPAGFNTSLADVDCSGNINILDALQIARYAALLINQFPCMQTPAPTPTPTPTMTPTNTGNTPDFGLIGFATLNGGTKGGAGGPSVTVNSGTALQAAINSGGPRIIYINGKITPANSGSLTKIDIKEQSNLSILGVGTSGEFEGIGIKLRYTSNVIIRNLKVHHVDIGDKDCLSIEGPANNIWIDHCELYNTYQGTDKDYYDGLLDAKADSAYMTFSWNYLHDSWKTSLVGSSDSDNYDRKITYHHNYFQNCNSRLPSYRFGTGHIYNNLYLDIPTSAVNTRMGAKLRIENNYFINVVAPITSLDSDAIGYWDVKDNIFSNCTGSQPTASNGSFTPPYSYTLTPANDVKVLVPAYAGVGKINF